MKQLYDRFKIRWAKLHWLHLWLPLAMIAMLPVSADWLLNRYIVSGQDLVVPTILSLLTATIVTIVFYRLYRRNALAGYIAAILSTVVFSNGYEIRFQAVLPLLRALNPIPSLQSEAVFSVVFMIIIFCLAYLVGRIISKIVTAKTHSSARLKTGLTIIIAVVFILQIVPLLRALIIEWPQFMYRPPQLASQAKVTDSTAKPDIYYIVLDDYTNQTVLKTQFNFDNADFTNFLNKNQFYQNPDAHNNYPYTTMSVAATLSANYHTNLVQKFANSALQILYPYHLSIRYAPVIQKLKSLGYSYYHIGSWYEASDQAPLADHYYQKNGQLTVFNKQITLDSFAQNELTQGLYSQFIKLGLKMGHNAIINYSEQPGIDMVQDQLRTLKTLAAEQAGGRFIFAHVLVPHEPYYFMPDGSLSPNSDADNVGEPVKQKYVDQIKFINGQMQTVINQIIKTGNDKSVIVMQSDEGPYPMELNDEDFNGREIDDEVAAGSMLNWSDTSIAMKYGALAAYRVPGANQQDFDKAGDGINIFRLVFNTYFNDNLGYLPRCYYGYADGRNHAFAFTDITKRVTGQANPACPKNSDFSTK